MDIEVIKQFELLIGSIGVIIGLFFGSFLLINRRTQPRANTFLALYLLALSLRIGKSLFHNYVYVDPSLRTMFLTLLLSVGPSIWLYTVHLLYPRRSIIRSDYYHYIPFLFFMATCWLIPNNGSAIFGHYYNFLIIHMAIYVLSSGLWLYAQKSKKESRVSIWLWAFILINLVFIIIYTLISFMFIPYYLGFSFLFSLLILSFAFWALRNPYLFTVPKEKYKNSNIDARDAVQLMKSLNDIMESQKPYLRPSINLSELSTELNISTKELSQAINQIESVNFSQYIAKYRIEEVKRLLVSDNHAHLKISAIAFDSGFSSISSFNAIFKKHTGLTASTYRKTHKS